MLQWVRTFGRNDLKLVGCDQFLIYMLLFVVLIALVLRFGLPWLNRYLAESGVLPSEKVAKSLADFYPLLIGFFVFFQRPLIAGAVFGWPKLPIYDADSFALRARTVKVRVRLLLRVRSVAVRRVTTAVLDRSTPWVVRGNAVSNGRTFMLFARHFNGYIRRFTGSTAIGVVVAIWFLAPGGSASDAVAQNDVAAPKASASVQGRPVMIRVRANAQAKPWTTADLRRAAARLRGATRSRASAAEGFMAEIEVYGKVLRCDSPEQALQLCETLRQLQERGADLQQFAATSWPAQTESSDPSPGDSDGKQGRPSAAYQPRSAAGRRKARDGDDGLDLGPFAGGGLGGIGGGYVLPPDGPSTVGASDTEPPQQATLKSRVVFRDYEQATFSFEHARRDDPDGVCGNDWDLQYGNGGEFFSVVMVADDRSVMEDLGASTWEQVAQRQLPQLQPLPAPRRLKTPAKAGHMYLVHTVDRDSNLYALFRVEKMAGGACDITWKRYAPLGA